MEIVIAITKVIMVKDLRTVLLDNSNYLIWKAQFSTILKENLLMEYVDGKKILDDDHATKQQDQLIFGWMLSTTMPLLVSIVASCDTSYGVWTTLRRRYGSNSRVRSLSLRQKLQGLRMGFGNHR